MGYAPAFFHMSVLSMDCDRITRHAAERSMAETDAKQKRGSSSLRTAVSPELSSLFMALTAACANVSDDAFSVAETDAKQKRGSSSLRTHLQLAIGSMPMLHRDPLVMPFVVNSSSYPFYSLIKLHRCVTLCFAIGSVVLKTALATVGRSHTDG
ncbi:hypothetical protein M513_13255 [Trichuris suis]|uniref:Uncharacterized protein n=1 Tax=Trichuris suis TaxID=68888 RepID=A0A085LLL9_9BILA|nr:hypothetical protein M513_13255 [Trichuris suis]